MPNQKISFLHTSDLNSIFIRIGDSLMLKILYKYFFILSLLIFSLSTHAAIPLEERNALIQLYNETTGNNWTNQTGWLGGIGTECNWHGVRCNDNDHVIDLILQQNNLKGTLPKELAELTQLQRLVLTSNALAGHIPIEFGQLTQLTLLYLFENQLSGAIPVEIGQLTQLSQLFLNRNQLSGVIPVEIGQLIQLEKLSLSRNQLSGSIPSEIGQLIQLRDLNLYENKLSGSIPTEIGQLTRLKELNLYTNELSGSIPAEIGQLTQLKELSISNNQLSGSIPAEIGRLLLLKELYLYQNALSGSIPAEIGQLTLLREIFLYHNQLSGFIPDEIGQLSQLKGIYLYNNKLIGSLPKNLANLKSLSTLVTHNNCLTLKQKNLQAFSQISHLDIGSQDACHSFINQRHIPIALTFRNALINIPLIEVEGRTFTADLGIYHNPRDSKNIYWKLKEITLIKNGVMNWLDNPPATFDVQFFTLFFNQIYYREKIIAATLRPYDNPDDRNGIYFQYSPKTYPNL